uniref:MULE transposase N-terminal all-beta domain-containing protein n=1 Tax=Brassica oleracea var. oleracea TaxID=109376 RepID=A0A0D3CRF4_BRAOL
MTAAARLDAESLSNRSPTSGEDGKVWERGSKLNFPNELDGHYEKSGDDSEWIPSDGRLYAISFKTSSLDDITYSFFKERICKKKTIDPCTKRLNLSYIPLVVGPKRQSYILYDEDVFVYLTSVDKEGRISILHVEVIEEMEIVPVTEQQSRGEKESSYGGNYSELASGLPEVQVNPGAVTLFTHIEEAERYLAVIISYALNEAKSILAYSYEFWCTLVYSDTLHIDGQSRKCPSLYDQSKASGISLSLSPVQELFCPEIEISDSSIIKETAAARLDAELLSNGSPTSGEKESSYGGNYSELASGLPEVEVNPGAVTLFAHIEEAERYLVVIISDTLNEAKRILAYSYEFWCTLVYSDTLHIDGQSRKCPSLYDQSKANAISLSLLSRWI